MRSCLVLGSGRSGSSMLAGVLAGEHAYETGNRPMPRDFRSVENPKGLFEDFNVLEINEDLLDPLFPRAPRLPWRRKRMARRILPRGQRWAAALPPDAAVVADSALDARIKAQLGRRPFCYKDPRFAFTLPAWRPHLGEAVIVCIFREPARTANSLVAEWRRNPARAYEMTYARALAHWRAAYGRVLEQHEKGGDWVFVHYDQVLGGDGISRLEEALDARVDHRFPDAALKRADTNGESGESESATYARLCSLAGMSEHDVVER